MLFNLGKSSCGFVFFVDAFFYFISLPDSMLHALGGQGRGFSSREKLQLARLWLLLLAQNIFYFIVKSSANRFLPELKHPFTNREDVL
jgi:hypothetical protein